MHTFYACQHFKASLTTSIVTWWTENNTSECNLKCLNEANKSKETWFFSFQVNYLFNIMQSGRRRRKFKNHSQRKTEGENRTINSEIVTRNSTQFIQYIFQQPHLHLPFISRSETKKTAPIQFLKKKNTIPDAMKIKWRRREKPQTQSTFFRFSTYLNT